jgi:hypothetical protein
MQEGEEKKARQPVCFVIGPIGKDGTAVRKHSDLLFHALVEPVVTPKYHCLRADMEQKPGLITDAIIQRINESDLVIADFTTLNPNVFYELGIRHAAAKPTIHMAADGTELPFDNAGNRVIFYDLADWHRQKRAQNELRSQLIETEQTEFQVTNPVTQALTIRAFSASADTEENAIANMLDRVGAIERTMQALSLLKTHATHTTNERMVSGSQLVETISQQTSRIRERHETLHAALQALIADGHISAPPTQVDNFLDAYTRDLSLFNATIDQIEAGDFAEIQQAVNHFDDIPF